MRSLCEHRALVNHMARHITYLSLNNTPEIIYFECSLVDLHFCSLWITSDQTVAATTNQKHNNHFNWL